MNLLLPHLKLDFVCTQYKNHQHVSPTQSLLWFHVYNVNIHFSQKCHKHLLYSYPWKLPSAELGRPSYQRHCCWLLLKGGGSPSQIRGEKKKVHFLCKQRPLIKVGFVGLSNGEGGGKAFLLLNLSRKFSKCSLPEHFVFSNSLCTWKNMLM